MIKINWIAKFRFFFYLQIKTELITLHQIYDLSKQYRKVPLLNGGLIITKNIASDLKRHINKSKYRKNSLV